MKKFLFIFIIFLFPLVAEGQTTIIIGPNSTLVWDTPGLGPALAQTCTYQIAQGAGAFSNVVGPVTCTSLAGVTSCSVNLVAQTAFTIGSGSITITTTCSGTVSLPSTPFAYVVVVVPVPANIRIK